MSKEDFITPVLQNHADMSSEFELETSPQQFITEISERNPFEPVAKRSDFIGKQQPRVSFGNGEA